MLPAAYFGEATNPIEEPVGGYSVGLATLRGSTTSSPNLKGAEMTGKIIKVSKNEGWGFISSKEIAFTRIFFHWTALTQDTLRFPELRNGMHVEFTPMEVQDKGWRAIHVKVIERPKTDEQEPDDNTLSALPE